jgi:hypothetical protein
VLRNTAIRVPPISSFSRCWRCWRCWLCLCSVTCHNSKNPHSLVAVHKLTRQPPHQPQSTNYRQPTSCLPQNLIHRIPYCFLVKPIADPASEIICASPWQSCSCHLSRWPCLSMSTIRLTLTQARSKGRLLFSVPIVCCSSDLMHLSCSDGKH